MARSQVNIVARVMWHREREIRTARLTEPFGPPRDIIRRSPLLGRAERPPMAAAATILYGAARATGDGRLKREMRR